MKRDGRLTAVARGAFVAVVSLLLCLSSRVPLAEAAIDWTKYGGNPVLEEGSLGDWDEAGVGDVCVISDGSVYKMWYTGLGTGRVAALGYATSTNGRSWTKDTANNPVLTKGSGTDFDEEGVGSCAVIKDGSTYKMWYTGYTDAGGSEIPAIGYATSSNGVSWVKSGSNPVLQPGSSGAWDEAGVLSPVVIQESDTSYKMWYTGRADDSYLGSGQIGYATSTDGIVWTKSGSNPVLQKGPGSVWDSRGISLGSVIKVGSSYQMWYTGYKGYGKDEIEFAIGRASSSNGISWTKDGSNPVLQKGSGWEAEGVGTPWVMYRSAGEYWMWYSGVYVYCEPCLGLAYYSPPEEEEGAPREEEEGGGEEEEEEEAVVDLTDVVDEDGVFVEDVTAESTDGRCELFIPEGTWGCGEHCDPLTELTIGLVEDLPPLPEDFSTEVIGLGYDFGPDGAEFDPPITLTFTYDPELIPDCVAEEDLVIAVWNEKTGEWVILEGCKVGPIANTISVEIDEFTIFTVLAPTRVAAFAVSALSISPAEIDIGQEATITALVANTGCPAGSYEVTLRVGDEVVATEEISLDGGASQQVTFTVTRDAAGTYLVCLDGSCGCLVVRPAAPSPPAQPGALPINWWIVAVIGAGCLVIGFVIALVATRRRQR